jgi:hypothetical protein
MRVFLWTLAVSILATIIFWNFGLAAKLWPAHPLICATFFAWVCAVITQQLLRAEAAQKKSQR